MEFAKLLIEYIKALIYPLLIFAFFIMFRKPIRTILERKISAKYRNFSFEIGRKNEILRSLQENYRIVARQLEDDLAIRQANGLVDDEHTKNLKIALETLNLNIDQHVVLDFIMRHEGISSASALVEKVVAKLNKRLNVNQLEKEKSRVLTAISELQHKGIVVKINEDTIRVNSLLVQLESSNVRD